MSDQDLTPPAFSSLISTVIHRCYGNHVDGDQAHVQMMIIYKYRRIAILVLLFVAITSILSRRIPQAKELNFIERLILDAAYPFQRAIIYISTGIRSIWLGYFYLINARRENIKLEQLVRELESEISELREAELENQRLRELLDFKDRLVWRTVPARVIGEDASGWFRIILIDKGKSSGIQRRMPVVAAGGLVGHVLESSALVSKVLLITDRNSALDSRIQRTRARGILEGNSSGGCVLKYLLQTDNVMPGDHVISSGMGGIYPDGLPLGFVSSIRKSKSGLYQVAEVTPHVDFSKLQEVLVILDHPYMEELETNSTNE
ncbi:MAG: rod shape-determining protein MreC [Deltaproteobacteria bacterium]|nr:rod shape-determining protein MreC [Deltaproteobacteria bacterium]